MPNRPTGCAYRPWHRHSVEVFGAAVVPGFELDAAYCAGRDLRYILCSGLAALSLAPPGLAGLFVYFTHRRLARYGA